MSERLENPELADALRQLEDVMSDAERLVANLDDEAFQWRPDPSRWSISECLDHLSASAESYAPRFEKCITEGRQKGKTGWGPPKRGWINGWLIRTLEPPATRRFKAPQQFLPGDPGPKAEVYPRFVRSHQELAAFMADADGLDLWKNRLTSPALSLLRFSLGEAFAMMVTHGRRHVWQGWEVRRSEGFPKPAALSAREQ